MKSERKQIQESNLLADKIEAQFVKLKAILPAVIAVVVVVVVSMLGYGIYSSIQEKEAAKAWTELYFSDTEAADLNAISSDYGSTSAGLWAKQTAGDAYMAKALEKVYVDRDLSDQYYQQALEEYKAVAEKTSDSFLKERSLYGMAQASEGLGEREQAISHYRKITVLPGLNPEFLTEINKRANWLDSQAGEKFYDWFKKNRPSAPVLQGLPSETPAIPSSPNFPLQPLPQTPAVSTEPDSK
jgi:tetratricopeptide (TPR) repeat protein